MTRIARDTVAYAGDATLPALVARAERLVATGSRRILGIAGAPGAGKSTICAALLDALGDRAQLVPMDGFHLANTELERLGRRDSKGAPHTFDVAGYVNLLSRLRAQTDDVIYAPTFDRGLEESIAGAVAVSPATPLVITEGNYLLLAEAGWLGVAPLLDETWFVDVPVSERRRRLVARRRSYGHSPDAALDWVARVDEANARIVEPTASGADLIIRVTSDTVHPDRVDAPVPTADKGVRP